MYFRILFILKTNTTNTNTKNKEQLKMMKISNKNMKIASGIIAGTFTAAAIGLIVKSTRKPQSKIKRNAARTLNSISAVTQSLANMIY